MSIRRIIVSTLIVLTILIFTPLLTGLHFLKHLDDDTKRIDVLTRARYHLDRLFHLTLSTRVLLAGTISEETESLASLLEGLRDGDTERGIPQVDDPSFKESLSRILKRLEDIEAPTTAQGRETVALLFEISTSLNDLLLKLEDRSSTRIRHFYTILILFTVAILLSVLGSTFFLSRRIIQPLGELTGGLKSLLSGNLDIRLRWDYHDEFGSIAKSCNRIVDCLKDSEARYVDLTRTIPDSVIDLGMDGTIRYVNEATLTMTGYGEGDLVGRNLKDFVPQDHHYKIDELMGCINSGSAVKNHELPFVFRDGRTNTLELSAVPVRKEGGIIGCRCVARNIEERKRIMEELEHARMEAERTSEKLKKTIKDLEEFAILAVRRELKMKEIREGFKRLREKT